MDEERKAFLRTIAEFPDDDTPRLVYSDWLRERGEDKHADLIEVSCELAQIQAIEHDCGENGVWATTCPACGAFSIALELSEREGKLITLVADIQGLRSYNTFLTSWIRGFIESITMSSSVSRSACWELINHPIHTVRLLDWHGIEEFLPPSPRKVMWSLKRVEIPRSFTRYSSFFGVYDCFGVTRKGNNTYRWYIDCIPGVEVKFWDNGNPYEGLSVHASH